MATVSSSATPIAIVRVCVHLGASKAKEKEEKFCQKEKTEIWYSEQAQRQEKIEEN